MPKINLSNKRLNAGGSSLLSPQGINPGPAARTAGINPSVGKASFTPVQPNVVQEDQILKSFLAAAGKVADRRAQVMADEAVLEYNDYARSAYHGKDGKAGYKDLPGADALDAYDGYNTSLDAKYKEITDKLAPGSRQKALLRMADTRSRYQSNGSSHNVTQLKVMEDQVLFVENQEIKKTIEAAGPAAWTDGSIDTHLAKYDTPEEVDAAAAELGTYTMYEEYNNTLASTSDAVKAYEAAVKTAEVVLTKVGPDGAQKIEYWLLNKRHEAEVFTKANKKKVEKTYQNNMIKTAPGSVVELAKKGNTAFANGTLQRLREAFPNNAVKGSTEVVKAFSTALEISTLNPKLVGVNSQVAVAQAMYSSMITAPGAHYSNDELADMQIYLDHTLPSAIVSRQRTKDTMALSALALTLSDVSKGSSHLSPQEPPKGMTQKNLETWDAMQETAVKNYINGVNSTDLQARGVSLDIYKGKLIDDTLTDKDVDDMAALVVGGKMEHSSFAAIAIEYEKTKKPGYKKPAYKDQAGYTAGKASIKSAGKLGIMIPGRPTKKVAEKNPELELQWQMATNLAVQKAIIEMDRAAKQSFKDGKEFDPNTWWTNYYSVNFNDGKEVGSTWWADIKSVLAAEGKDLTYFFTGNTSVFDGEF